MIGYAAVEVFTKAEIELWGKAALLVERTPDPFLGDSVRCHELARAVGRVLGLKYQDGRFGFVEHTWLWLSPLAPELTPWVLPRILDVYVPGAMPQVQLIDTASGLPPRYYLSNMFNVEIREDVVDALVEDMMKAAKYL